MLYYRDPLTSNVFGFETVQEREQWGAAGLVEMTPQEVLDHLNPPPVEPTPAEQIAALERQNLLPKATRKFMLSFMEQTAIQQGAAQGFTPEQSLAALAAGNPGYAAVKALDNQIEALEAML